MRLDEKISHFTVRPNGEASATPTRIVLVPPRGDLAAGFELAKTLLATGPIRLVAPGCTIERTWPAWVRQAEGLWLTELGAYVTETRVRAAAEVRAQLCAWLDGAFAGALAGLRGSDVFYGSAGLR